MVTIPKNTCLNSMNTIDNEDIQINIDINISDIFADKIEDNNSQNEKEILSQLNN